MMIYHFRRHLSQITCGSSPTACKSTDLRVLCWWGAAAGGSHQCVGGEHGGDGGEGQLQSSGETGGRVTQVAVAAGLGHGVGGGVGGRGEVRAVSLVAVGYSQAALRLDVQEARCCSFAAEALLSGGAGRLAGAAQAPEAQLALEAFQRVDCEFSVCSLRQL